MVRPMKLASRSALGALLLALGLLLAPTAHAAGLDLGTARAAYDDGDYAQVRDQLRTLLQYGNLSTGERLEARTLLAASLLFLKERDAAKDQLRTLFREAPQYRVDAKRFPPAVVELSEEVRLQLLDLRNTPSAPMESPPPFALAFVPFGTGQFVTGRPGIGAVFLATEAVAFGAAAVGVIQAERLKEPGPDNVLLVGGTVTTPNLAAYERWERLYVYAFWSGVGLAAVGIAEAVWSWPQTGSSAPTGPAATPAAPPATSLRLLPNGLVVRF